MTNRRTIRGVVSVPTDIIFTVPNYAVRVLILDFRAINTASDYLVSLVVYDALVGSYVEVLSAELTKGDTLTDSLEYVLNPGDHIRISSDAADTSYSLTIQVEQ